MTDTSTNSSTPTPFRPARRRRAFEEVILQIEEAIVQGDYQAGDRLPNERDLAAMMEVGRSSIREALRVLEAFGVLVARPGRGEDSGSMLVAEGNEGLVSILRLHISLRRIPPSNLFQVRRALEILVAREAPLHVSQQEIEELREVVRQMGTTADVDASLELDARFHAIVGTASRNVLAQLLMEGLRKVVSDSQRESLKRARIDQPHGRARLTAQHQRILRCIEAGDSASCVSAMSDHLDDAYSRLIDD